MTAAMASGVDGAFFGAQLDVDLLDALDRRHPLFVAWSHQASADARPEPAVLTLDGDPHALFAELMDAARFMRLIRAEAAAAPYSRVATAVRKVDWALHQAARVRAGEGRR